MTKISILGIGIHTATSQEVIESISTRLKKQQKTFIITINPEIIMQAQRDSDYKEILNQADLSVADGIGVVWAASVYSYKSRVKFPPLKFVEIFLVSGWLGITTLLGKSSVQSPISERITGVDLSYQLASQGAVDGYSLFLLGAQPGVAKLAAEKLQALYPNLTIAGTFAGQGSASGDAESTAQLIANPSEVVLVAFGAPKQEYWIARNLQKIPQIIAIGVGGTFMFMSGKVRRAPKFIRLIGLEWLFRLITQPWRWQRQLALPQFLVAVILDKIKQQ